MNYVTIFTKETRKKKQKTKQKIKRKKQQKPISPKNTHTQNDFK